MMGWYNDGWGGGWLAMALMMVFWIALIGVAIWAAVRLVGSGSKVVGTMATPTPRTVLDHRLASGEIDAEQYAQLRRLLDGVSAGTVTTDTKAPH
ncbi:MAG TPA: SHOCT domain-containing protein [Ornithinibacter sp.]|nr:SHOCT domain-containing protein [Ornithinibacter sp.]